MRVYSDKSFLVSGNTKPYYTELKKFGGTWISKPRDGKDKGWCYSNMKFDEVKEYIEGVNLGYIAAPPQSAPMQTLHWEVFRPSIGMKLNVGWSKDGTTNSAIYIVSSVESNYPVMNATIQSQYNQNDIRPIMIVNGEWKVLSLIVAGYENKITPIIEPKSNDIPTKYIQMANQLNNIH